MFTVENTRTMWIWRRRTWVSSARTITSDTRPSRPSHDVSLGCMCSFCFFLQAPCRYALRGCLKLRSTRAPSARVCWTSFAQPPSSMRCPCDQAGCAETAAFGTSADTWASKNIRSGFPGKGQARVMAPVLRRGGDVVRLGAVAGHEGRQGQVE